MLKICGSVPGNSLIRVRGFVPVLTHQSEGIGNFMVEVQR